MRVCHKAKCMQIKGLSFIPGSFLLTFTVGRGGALKCPFFYFPKYYGDSNWCLKFSSVLGFFWLLVFVVVVFTLQK